MKKYLMIFIVLDSFLLTSCQVHFGQHTFDVHWLVIAIPAFIILLTVMLSLERARYYCPRCNKTFYVSRIKCLFSAHVNDERALKCPHCKKSGICYPSYNQEDEK